MLPQRPPGWQALGKGLVQAQGAEARLLGAVVGAGLPHRGQPVLTVPVWREACLCSWASCACWPVLG